jgi:Bacterial SH3 domain
LTFERPFRILVPSVEEPAETIAIANSSSNRIRPLAMHKAQRHQRSIVGMFGKIVMYTLLLGLVLAGALWFSTRFLATREASQMETDRQRQEISFFEYRITAETGHVRVNGTANFPNGVILVGTLDRVGSGPIEVKEALVMNRLFAMEFGPKLSVQYYLHDPQDALQAGVYRMSVEFDPSQQSPFARESLLRSPLMKASPTQGDGSREIDPAIIRVSKMLAIGTAGEQEEARAREQQYRQTIRQHLSDALGTLTNFWQRLYARYEQERLKGGLSRGDPRASEWQTWKAQWLNDLKDFGESARLYEIVSPVSPYHAARDALAIVHKQLAVMPDLYFEALTHERSLADRDLDRAEQVAQYALGDAFAQLGQPDSGPSPSNVESVKPTVIVTSPVVHIRSGPGMSHESFRQARKDEVLNSLGEQGEWFHVQLGDGRTGWVHRNVVNKRPQGEGTSGDVKRVEIKPFAPERRPQLQLEPIRLLSTPIELIPPPTSDEVKIYAGIEQQLRDLQVSNLEERRTVEHRVLQQMSDKHGISPEQVWNTYLKVQGWEIKP